MWLNVTLTNLPANSNFQADACGTLLCPKIYALLLLNVMNCQAPRSTLHLHLKILIWHLKSNKNDDFWENVPHKIKLTCYTRTYLFWGNIPRGNYPAAAPSKPAQEVRTNWNYENRGNLIRVRQGYISTLGLAELYLNS